MKKILIALAVILSVQVAGAQVKSAADSKKAVEAAEAAAQNPKKATKPATWLKVGDTYIDAYTSPYGNAWVGAGKQELTLIMGAEKPSSTETVELMGETFTKEVYPEKNFYFNAAGVLSTTFISIIEHYKLDKDIDESFQSWLEDVTTEPSASWAIAAAMINLGASLERSPVLTALILGIFAVFNIVDEVKTMLSLNFDA